MPPRFAPRLHSGLFPNAPAGLKPRGATLSVQDPLMLLLLLLASADTHWAFDPVARQTGSIDAFLGARLAKAGLSANPPADRPALLRRLAFDVVGLPPTPQEVRAFVNDTRPDAYERVVD